MENAFDKAHPEYKDYVKVFLFGDRVGREDDIKKIVHYSCTRTVTHFKVKA